MTFRGDEPAGFDGQTDMKEAASHVESQGEKESQVPIEENLAYNIVDEEPEIHLQTYIAVAAMLFLNYVQIIALQGPPVVVSGVPVTDRLCCKSNADGNILAGKHWAEPAQHARPDLGTERSLSCPSRTCPDPFVGIRHFSGPKNYHGRYLCRVICWSGHRAGIRQYL